MTKYIIVGATAPGAKHAYEPTKNQDFFAWKQTNEAALLAVCDGAGSASNSRQGAELAANMCISFLEEQASKFCSLETNVFHENILLFLETIKTAFTREALNAGDAPLGSFATTLLAIIMHNNGYAAFQIGDGFIVIKDNQGYRLLFKGSKGEYYNETLFVTSNNVASNLQSCISNELCGYACLSSDGLERQAIDFSKDAPHIPFFDYLQRITKTQNPRDMLESFLTLPIINKATDDDRTILMAQSSEVNSISITDNTCD